VHFPVGFAGQAVPLGVWLQFEVAQRGEIAGATDSEEFQKILSVFHLNAIVRSWFTFD
jgi:hypothetical protein